jgi:hypothetical protein
VHGLAPAQHRHVVGVAHHFAELVRDDQHRAHAAACELPHMAQHLVGLLRCQHGRRLVQDQQARPQVELLEQFELLFFPGGQLRWARIEVQPERCRPEKLLEFDALGFPVDQRRRLATRQQQVLGHRHARRQREMLVHHADPERPRHHRVGDVLLAPVGDDAAYFGAVKAGDALDQRALARAVFTKQRMHGAWRHFHRDVVERGKAAEALGQLVSLQRHGAGGRRDRLDGLVHRISSLRA